MFSYGMLLSADGAIAISIPAAVQIKAASAPELPGVSPL